MVSHRRAKEAASSTSRAPTTRCSSPPRPRSRSASCAQGRRYTYTELGGLTQKVQFDPGQYINPGPWRLPYHHQGILHYVNRLGVALEPFTQVNFNAYVHNTDAFSNKPVRFKTAAADFEGNVAELLAKAVNQNALDQELTAEDRQKLLEALRMWGMLDKDMKYKVFESEQDNDISFLCATFEVRIVNT